MSESYRSNYGDAVRELLEPTLVCPKCDARNSPTLRTIRVDVNGIACCSNCGRGGSIELFQPKEQK